MGSGVVSSAVVWSGGPTTHAAESPFLTIVPKPSRFARFAIA